MTAIDLGSRKAVIGKYKKSVNQYLDDGVEVISNALGKRETQVCIAWIKEKQRIFGQAAYSQAGRNQAHTFLFLTRLIGLTKEDQVQIAIEQKFCLFDLQVDNQANSKLYVEIENKRFYMEQIMAAFLRKIFMVQNQCKVDEESKDGITANVQEVFVTYPSYATEKQRQALYNACIISDIGKPKLICESTAIVVDYAS